MFKVWFTNHGYFSDRTFNSARDALEHAKGCGFQCTVHHGNYIVFGYCPIGGLRVYLPSFRFLYQEYARASWHL